MPATRTSFLSIIILFSLVSPVPAGSPEIPPPTRVETVTGTYHGTPVEDPFRWLENWDAPEVREWTAAQNKHTRQFLDRLPNREAIRKRVTEIMKAEIVSHWAVTPRGGRFFAYKDQPPKQQPFLVVMDSLDEAGLQSARTLVDPNEIDPEGGTTIDFFRPSPDGTLVAVSLSKHGTEAGDLHFFETATGEPVFEVIPRVHTGTASGDCEWTPDGSGVFYTRHPREGERPAEDLNFFQQAWFHELGQPLGTDRYELGKDFPRIAEIEFDPHHKTGRILLTVQDGDGGEFAHYLRSPEGDWRQFSQFGDKTVKAAFSHDGSQLFLLSRENAPRGKLLQIETDSLDTQNAAVVIPQSEDTIVNSFYGRPPTIIPTESRLFVQYQTGGPGEIRVFDLKGNPMTGPEQLPVGRAGGMTRLENEDSILFSQTSYTHPWATLRFSGTSGETSPTAVVSRSPVDFEGVTARREFASSKDGTRVPVNLILPEDTLKGTPRPILVTGYGGYGISLSPGFSALRKVYLEQGVTLAVANLRGGGEYGEEWHRQGNLTNKQNVFDDFAAVLRHLVDEGYTTSDLLAIEGGSNGGLLMGATLVQQPELMRCVVSHVGIYDMLRVELSPNGSFNIPEFGTVKNPDHFRALRAYSPYHNVVAQTRYPATLFLTGVNDPRVDAMQSRKMTARLQAAGAAPVLLRTSLDSGHGSGTPLDEQIRQEVDVHAFVFDQLGVNYQPPSEKR